MTQSNPTHLQPYFQIVKSPPNSCIPIPKTNPASPYHSQMSHALLRGLFLCELELAKARPQLLLSWLQDI